MTYYPATTQYLQGQGLSDVLNPERQPNEALALALASGRKDGPPMPDAVMDLWAYVLSDLQQQVRCIEMQFIRHARRLHWSWQRIADALELDNAMTAERRSAVLENDRRVAQTLKKAKSGQRHPGLV